MWPMDPVPPNAESAESYVQEYTSSFWPRERQVYLRTGPTTPPMWVQYGSNLLYACSCDGSDGSPPASVAERWVSSAPAWPGHTGAARARMMPLIPTNARYAIETAVDGRRLRLLLDSGSPSVWFVTGVGPREYEPTVSSPLTTFFGRILARRRLAAGGDLSVFGTPRLHYCEAPPSLFGGQNLGASGLVGFAALNSRRILVDFPGKALFLEPVDEEMADSLFLTGLLGRVPLRVGGGELFLGPLVNDPEEKWRELDGAVVETICGVTSETLATALLSGEKRLNGRWQTSSETARRRRG